MSKRRRLPVFIVLFLAIAAVAAGIYWTASNDQPVVTEPAKPVKGKTKPVLVDEGPWLTARRIAKHVNSKEENEFAQAAVRLSDHELDLAFNTALRQAQNNVTAAGKETLELRKHVLDLETEVKEDQGEIKQMTAQLESKGKTPDGLQEQLELTQAELSLHQEELDDARQDLERGGDDAEARIQRMLAEHQQAENETSTTAPIAPSTNTNSVNPSADSSPTKGPAKPSSQSPSQDLPAFKVPSTLADQVATWQQLGKKLFYLNRARQLAADYSQKLDREHDELEAQMAQETAKAAPGVAPIGHSDRVANLKRQADERQSLAEYDKRVRAQQQLSQNYANWMALIAGQRESIVHAALYSLLWILIIIAVLMLIALAIDHFLVRLQPDKRRQSSMRLVIDFLLQCIGIVGALFVIFGRPSQLSTVLGLAGAGLTVALKDFIVGFFGWFILMGKNGVRVGDWVEINGVGGEVVEIGLLRTILLETGNWSDSGHPTGRKVTFVNSYAIEGHYFNFTTAGQWLWDTLELLIPAGQSPYKVTDAVMKYVAKETEADAKEAEQEWQRANHEYGVQTMSATPSVSIRPSLQGINMIVRYITRAHQRYDKRTHLYEGVIGLLHERNINAVDAAE